MADGIIMPHLAHRFRVDWQGVGEEFRETIALQVVNFSVDYVNEMATLIIEQPAVGGALHDFLREFLKRETTIDMVAINGDGNELYRIRYNLMPTAHDFIVDYGSSDAARHTLEFHINRFYAVSNEE